MAEVEQDKSRGGAIRFWMGQAVISLLAAFVAAQNFRHGNFVTMPTTADIMPILVTFAVIFAAVASLTLISRRLNTRPN
jgi:uncharacterized membrane protein YhaH (DUF805 family)